MAQQIDSNPETRKHSLQGPGTRHSIGVSNRQADGVNLETIARIYIHCVQLEENARSEESNLAGELAVFRSELHALLMSALKSAEVPFVDRADAARIAHKIIEA